MPNRLSSPKTKLEQGMIGFGSALALASVALTGCNEGGKQHEYVPRPAATATPTAVGNVMLRFTALGGGSTIIQVYPGVTGSAADRKSNGTYNDGDSVAAECKTTGRTVHSHPELGEQDRTSSEWVRIHGTPGETQFATAVYIQDSEKALAPLPAC